MTSPQDRITDAVRRGQETVNTTVRSVSGGVNSAQERITEAVRQGQETVNSTARTVTDGVRTMSDGMQKLVSGFDVRTVVPTLEDLVDRSYSFAVQVLSVQRDFAKSLLAYAAPLPETTAAPAKRTTSPTRNATTPAAKKNS